jgi:hypothetical protein
MALRYSKISKQNRYGFWNYSICLYYKATFDTIKKFADPAQINYDRENQMKYLHLEMLKKYVVALK